MIEKLDILEQRYRELGITISDPDVIAKQDEWQRLMKEHAHIQPIVEKYREYKEILKEIEDSYELLEEELDDDFRSLVQEELEILESKKEAVRKELQLLLLPKDPNDERNVVMEIRGGAGGEEAALFAADLLRMYTRYAERNGWRWEIMNANYTDMGGVKEVIFAIEGKGAYSRLKYESGVHRVQRVPTTESGGRIHTSTVTVAVLPEAEDVEVDIDPKDIQIDVFRSSGHGGQSVNTTDSAVRLTHIPTGLVVTCQDERSQHKNREKAMRVLKARLYDMLQTEQQSEYAEERRSQIGTGDRSERIRTYNFPQGRVTDHRIGYTIHQLDMFLDGDIDEMLDALIKADQAEHIKKMAQ
ncbi:MAG TPA: peptide chain release factor 1 [Clostridiales bacterium]|nr:peptide chain release factor 1 [Clostridiales bacterium]